MTKTAAKDPQVIDQQPKQDVAVAEQSPLSKTMAPDEQTATMLNIFRDIAMSPDSDKKVDVIAKLADIQRQLMQDQAERALNDALAQLNLPHVKKNGKIPLPNKDGTIRDVNFAKWEDIDTAIRPLLREFGLSLSFSAPKRSVDGGGSDMKGWLHHRQGAKREAEISLPLDTGPGRNNLQAMGSTISYGKKYLAFMLLNIVTEGEDDDGLGSEAISIEQAAGLDTRLRKLGEDFRVRFLKWIGTDDLLKIPGSKYVKAEKRIIQEEQQVAAAIKKGVA